MNKKKNIIMIIALSVFLALVAIATYSFFATGSFNISNAANLNVVSERNNMVFDTIGGELSLNITAGNMGQGLAGNVAAENSATLRVNFTANTSYYMTCTYDIVYEWTSTDKYTAHTAGVSSNEFTTQASLTPSNHVSEGANAISTERDLATFTYINNSTTVVTGAMIDSVDTDTNTAVWTITSRFHNVDADQSALSGKTYVGKYKVANVSCAAGTVPVPSPTSYWFPTTFSTWDDSTNQYLPTYTFPASGGTVQSTGTATGHNVYIGQDSSKYYVCATISGHEICLSQPYTQYGLSGHTYCFDESCYFSSEQQTSAKQAIYQAFIDAGITLDISDCDAGVDRANCIVGGFDCEVYFGGYVQCYDGSVNGGCGVDPLGRASCNSLAAPEPI